MLHLRRCVSRCSSLGTIQALSFGHQLQHCVIQQQPPPHRFLRQACSQNYWAPLVCRVCPAGLLTKPPMATTLSPKSAAPDSQSLKSAGCSGSTLSCNLLSPATYYRGSVLSNIFLVPTLPGCLAGWLRRPGASMRFFIIELVTSDSKLKASNEGNPARALSTLDYWKE